MAKRLKPSACIVMARDDGNAVSGRDFGQDKSIARIQELLDQDEHSAPPSNLSDLIAFHSTASELASILKEDSPNLLLNWSSLTDVRQLAAAAPAAAPQEDELRMFASLSKGSGDVLGSRVVLYANLNGYCTPSKVLDVGLLRPVLGSSSVPVDRARDNRSNAAKSADAVDKQKMSFVQKPPWDSSTCISSVHRSTDMAVKKAKFYENQAGIGLVRGSAPFYIDFHDMLLQCAHKIGSNDTQGAMAVAFRVKQEASPRGNASDRLAYYFVKALYARFQGTGWSLYMGQLKQPRPSPRQILAATLKYVSRCPFTKASHLFANETILKVARGASALHIIEHQLTGIQYPSLFKELAALPGGPPKVFLVGLVVPHYSMFPAQTDVIYKALEETGDNLAKCASSFNIPFHFTPWVGMRENMRVQDFVSSKRPPNEKFVFISACFLRFVMDNVLDPRPIRIRSFRSLSDACPDVFIQGIVSGAYSSPFYPVRFKEALSHFSCLFDVLDTFIERENDIWSSVFESEVLGKAILNVVACEGLLVLQRVEKYKEWQAVAEGTGMQQLSLNKNTKCKVKEFLQRKHKDYIITEDRNYLLLGWKGRILYALSTWKSPASALL